MSLLVVIIVIIALIALSVMLENRWQAARGVSTSSTAPESAPMQMVTTLTNQVATGVNQLRNSLARKQEPHVVQAFALWAAEALDQEPGLQAWIAALPAPALQALTDQVTNFCAEMNLNLAWLVEHRLDDEPGLKRTAAEIVVAYCTACWKAVGVQSELQIFDVYQRFLHDPTSRQYRALRQQLFAQLIERGLAALPPAAELVLASDAERQTYAVEAIQQAAQRHPAAFRATLNAVVLAMNSAEEGVVSADLPPTQPA